MATKRPRSASPFIWILVLSVIATAIFAGTFGYVSGSRNLAEDFDNNQLQFIDGLVIGTVYKVERDAWLRDFENKEASANDFRATPGQRCAGKFFPDQPVAMKGCLIALEPRPPKGYQYPI